MRVRATFFSPSPSGLDVLEPTDAELAILQVLWTSGGATVREVHEVLEPATGVGYTTILKTLQIMTDKGWLQRDERQRSHVYRPRQAAERTQQHLLGDLIDRAFAGSTSTRTTSPGGTKRPGTVPPVASRRIVDFSVMSGCRTARRLCFMAPTPHSAA